MHNPKLLKTPEGLNMNRIVSIFNINPGGVDYKQRTIFNPCRVAMPANYFAIHIESFQDSSPFNSTKFL